MNEMNADNQGKPCGKVEAVFSTCQRIVQVHLGGSVVRTTADHPFYVEGKGWVSAAEMPGATSDGEQVVFRPVASEQPNTEQPRPDFPLIGFVAGAPILTPDGSKPIESIKPGDVILTQPGDGQDHHEPDDHEDDRTGEGARWWEWN